MIIKKFEEQVQQFPDHVAVKVRDKCLTYRELNRQANRIANELTANDNAPARKKRTGRVALLFEHGHGMIAGIIGTLKARKTYVPLDISYPRQRLAYMLEHSGAGAILTNNKNLSAAKSLITSLSREITLIVTDQIDNKIPGENIPGEAIGDRPAYILYTSGSTGKPKGVVQTHENVLYFIRHWTERFSISGADRLTLLTSLSHDGAIPDIFAALLNNAVLYPYDIKASPNMDELSDWLVKEKLTLWHSVPTFYRYFIGSLNGSEKFSHLRLVILGGEEVREQDVLTCKTFFPHSTFANIYGQTESTVNSIWLLPRAEPFERVSIGEPIGDTEIFLLDEMGDIVEEMGVGEIVIASEHVAREYWRDKKSSEQVFIHDRQGGKLYLTGDLGQLLADGSIMIHGRKDSQVKIRGFRVERGEIESVLVKHKAVKEAVVIAKTHQNMESYLCAYIVSPGAVSPAEIKEFLSRELPDYMIPGSIINIEKMPLTPSGKIDSKALPEPGFDKQAIQEYEAPGNEMEKTLVILWQELLGVDKISVHANFFEAGGHSLLVITLISKIHQVFDIELQLKDVFDHPTVKELSQFMITSKQTVFSAIEPGEKKEYYPAATEQRRMFILNEFEGIHTTYNLPDIIKIRGKLAGNLLEPIFQKLIKRHHMLRTSFRLIDGTLVQQVQQEVDFHITYIDVETGNRNGEGEIQRFIKAFVRPFDLRHAPLIRASLLKLSADEHLLLMDLHHIAADGVSLGILVRELFYLYEDRSLPPLRLQYQDFSQWQFRWLESPGLKDREKYWLDRFAGELPVLDLPNDYPRGKTQHFAGDILVFKMDGALTKKIKALMLKTETTLFMVLLAVYNVLLFKYTEQEDIIVGTPVSMRNHADLQNIIGMLVNTLAIRNFPGNNHSFRLFLQEVKANALNAYAHQEYPFEELVARLGIERSAARNPVFDTLLVSENLGLPLPGNQITELEFSSYPLEINISHLDLVFYILEEKDEVKILLEYATAMFKQSTIREMGNHYIEIVQQVLENSDILLKDISVSHRLTKAKPKISRETLDNFGF